MERLAGQAICMALKAGSWYQACSQGFDHDAGHHILFLFPGWRDMRDLQQAGLAQSPPGTIMAEPQDPDSTFQMADDDGWLPLDRFSGRLLALAIAAIIDRMLRTARRTPRSAVSSSCRVGSAAGIVPFSSRVTRTTSTSYPSWPRPARSSSEKARPP